MKFGVVSYNTEYGIRPDDAAREAAARGFESIWFPEHTNIPVSRETPFALGGDLPEQYKHFMDLFVSLTAAAMAAPEIRVGAGICLLAQHDPIIAAKAVATLDYVSRGRVMFGIGGGWNREELENHGVRFEDRWKVLRERIAAMKVMWTEEEASFHGEFVNFDPIWSYPKPVQKPYPPVYFGAVSKAGIRRVVADYDGWLLVDPQDGSVGRAAAEFDELCAEAGRDRDTICVTVFATQPLDRELLDSYAEARVDRVISFLDPDTAAASLAIMDASAAFIGDYR